MQVTVLHILTYTMCIANHTISFTFQPKILIYAGMADVHGPTTFYPIFLLTHYYFQLSLAAALLLLINREHSRNDTIQLSHLQY